AVFGGGHALNNFLAPVFAGSADLAQPHHIDHSTELILMGVVVGLTLIVIYFAYNQYVKKASIPAPETAQRSGFEGLVYNKYYVDELYDKAVTKPLNFLSRALDTLVERLMIDQVVNSAGRGGTWGGRTVRLGQGGSSGVG